MFANTKISSTFAHANENNAEVAQLVEHNLAKVRVAGSSPVFRSFFFNVARVVESVDTRDLKSRGHCGCAGSSPASSTTWNKKPVESNISTGFLFQRHFLFIFKNQVIVLNIHNDMAIFGNLFGQYLFGKVI